MDLAAEQRPRVLVIEDSKTDQSIYRHTLRDYDLSFADSGESGLDRLDREKFGLVILDFHLPRMNGDEVLRAIRDTLNLEIPVVVVTGGGSASVAVDLLKRGASDYVTKDELHTPRVASAVQGSLKRHWLELARRKAEDELRTRNGELMVAMRQLQEAQAQLVQSEKMASLGQLVAGVAHEINNPLAYVSNNIAVLDRDVRHLAEITQAYRAHLGAATPQEILDREEVVDLAYTMENLDRLLKSSRQGLQRVREIVSGLRDFSRLDEADRKQIDPNEAVLTTLELVRYHIRQKGVHLALDLGQPPLIWCFAGKLNQVLLNILMNAIQAVGPGNTIEVSTSARGEGGEVEFVIKDDGPGIPESIRGRIYDPFFTTKPQGVGTGLGLWISYNIVSEHGGRIELTTEEGKGTTFSIILPVSQPGDPG
ncbi:ATP-binding protein [Isosphaeraceae bacterium EP7]